jgi:hypothetical protein
MSFIRYQRRRIVETSIRFDSTPFAEMNFRYRLTAAREASKSHSAHAIN